jgi:hypothetical protein
MKKEAAQPLLFFCDVLLAFAAIIFLGLGAYGTAKGFFSFVLGTSLFMGTISLHIIYVYMHCTYYIYPYRVCPYSCANN